MTSFDPERFVQQLMEKLQSLDFVQWIELPLDSALEEIYKELEEQTFHATTIAFVQSVYNRLPNSHAFSDAHAWDLANRMLDLAYPCEGSTGSTAAFLDYTSGDVCTAEHLYSTLSCGLKQHLQNQYTQTSLSEHLAGVSFSERIAVARFIQPQYEPLGISIPTHHLAHSLERVLMQVFEMEQVRLV